jgi:hypothetical protein
MVITTTVDILINNNNVKHYNKKGYKCISGDVIEVNYNDSPSYTKLKCTCDQCNISYTTPKSTFTKQKHPGLCKSCSSQQSKYSTVTNLSGQKFGKLIVIELHNNTPGGEKYWECLCECGNKKITSGRSLKTNKTTSCGCYYKEVLKNVIIPKFIEKNKKCVGEKHPNWDPTKSNKERFTLRKYEISVLRKKTFERDNHTCQCCFNRGGKVLNAHHIVLFSQNVELRYNLDNLITLCYECHVQYHSKYKKNINQETLNEYRKEVNFGVQL